MLRGLLALTGALFVFAFVSFLAYGPTASVDLVSGAVSSPPPAATPRRLRVIVIDEEGSRSPRRFELRPGQRPFTTKAGALVLPDVVTYAPGVWVQYEYLRDQAEEQ